MDPRLLLDATLTGTRRQLLKGAGLGLGAAALGHLDARHAGLPAPGSILHAAPRAKRAIWLFMAGAPTQIETFDHKPELARRHGEELPASVRGDQRLTTMTSGQKGFPLAMSRFAFKRHDNGGDGAEVSELFPHTAKIVDKLAIVRSVWTTAINHDPAITFITTGRELPGWPSLGSWLSYGLGSGNEDLPTFVVMTPRWTGRPDAQALYQRLWGSGMLPSVHQGVALRSEGDPVLFLKDPKGIDRASRRRFLDALGRINAERAAATGDPATRARTAQYEMAFRMQSSVPELLDLSGESKETLDLYGPDASKPGTFASSCLMARRMVERGVRFVQIFHRGWDQHFKIPEHLPKQCRDVDQPAAALVEDLDRRGMLDDTLVVWGGEFGRTAYCQGPLTKTNYGRDHHPRCFSMWLAGGGIQGGVVHGETDDFSYNVVSNPVHVRDLNATVLHLLGLEHERLSIQHQGLDVRLTGVEPARIVREILA